MILLILDTIFEMLNIILGKLTLKGDKLFKLYFYLVSEYIVHNKGLKINHKELAILLGICKLENYNQKWFYQGHKIYQ